MRLVRPARYCLDRAWRAKCQHLHRFTPLVRRFGARRAAVAAAAGPRAPPQRQDLGRRLGHASDRLVPISNSSRTVLKRESFAFRFAYAGVSHAKNSNEGARMLQSWLLDVLNFLFPTVAVLLLLLAQMNISRVTGSLVQVKLVYA